MLQLLQSLQTKPLFIFLLSQFFLFTPAQASFLPVLPINESCLKNGFYDCSQCECNVTGVAYSSFIFILRVLCLFLSCLFIFGFTCYPDLRKRPGSLVLALAITCSIYSVGAIMTTFNAFKEPEIGGDDSLCEYIGYFTFACMCLTYCYQGSFFIYYTRSTKLRQHEVHNLGPGYHIIPIFLTIIAMCIAYSQTGFGRTVYGSCEIKTSADVGNAFLGVVSLVGTAFCVFHVFRTGIKRVRITKNADINVLNHYKRYLLSLCVLYGVLGIVNILIAAFISHYKPDHPNSATMALVISGVLASLLRAVNPFIVVMAWTRDPDSRETMRKAFGHNRVLGWIWGNMSSRRTSHRISINRFGSVDQDHFEASQRLLWNESYIDSVVTAGTARDHGDIVDINSKDYRIETIFTIMTSVLYYLNIKKREKELNIEIDIEPITPVTKDIKYEINQDLIAHNIPKHFDKVKAKEYKIRTGTLTVHGPSAFQEIMRLDEVGKNFYFSLDLANNLDKIIRKGYNPQGNKRTFYFVSSDNRLLFQSVSNSELKSLLKMLPQYVSYLQSNPHSLLSKVYGAFTYEIAKPYQKHHLLILRNVNRFPSYNLERVYELQGVPRFRRTIMDEDINRSELRHSGILKDYDFNKFEKAIKVGHESQAKLLEALKQDVEFLISQNRIDYILALYVVKKERLPSLLSTVNEMEEEQQDSFGDLDRSIRLDSEVISDTSEVFDTEEHTRRATLYSGVQSRTENVDYVLGITDYLGEFTFGKRVRLWLRKLGFSGSRQSLTTEKPGIYGNRFMDYLEKIIAH